MQINSVKLNSFFKADSACFNTNFGVTPMPKMTNVVDELEVSEEAKRTLELKKLKMKINNYIWQLLEENDMHKKFDVHDMLKECLSELYQKTGIDK